MSFNKVRKTLTIRRKELVYIGQNLSSVREDVSCEMSLSYGEWDTSRPPVATTTSSAQLWWDQQWMNLMAVGRWEAFSMVMIWSELIIDPLFIVSNLSSHKMAACDRRVWKAYLESVEKFM